HEHVRRDQQRVELAVREPVPAHPGDRGALAGNGVLSLDPLPAAVDNGVPSVPEPCSGAPAYVAVACARAHVSAIVFARSNSSFVIAPLTNEEFERAKTI